MRVRDPCWWARDQCMILQLLCAAAYHSEGVLPNLEGFYVTAERNTAEGLPGFAAAFRSLR
eukprot:scaffold8031_cov267-Pinguiococcus_pyrenoidosus.AAC.3